MATPEVTPGFEWVLRGEGVATVKYDGSCTMIKDGKFYKDGVRSCVKTVREMKAVPEALHVGSGGRMND